MTSGCALPHHIYPEPSWVNYWITNSDHIPAVMKLFNIEYEWLRFKSLIPYEG